MVNGLTRAIGVFASAHYFFTPHCLSWDFWDFDVFWD
jgi:hypothetical protein